MLFAYKESLVKSIENQILNYNRYKESLENLKSISIVNFDRVAFNFDFFDALNKERLYMAHRSRKDKVNLYNFFVFHSYFKNVEQDMGEQYKELMERFRGLMGRWNVEIKSVHDFMSNLNVSGFSFTDAEKEELMEIYRNKNLNNSSSLQEIVSLWIIPFIEILTKKYNSVKGSDSDLYKYIKDFHSIKEIYDEFGVLNQSAIEYVDGNITTLNTSLKQINNI